MSDTKDIEAIHQVFLWQHDDTGRTCWSNNMPGPQWYRVGTPDLCLRAYANQAIAERDARIAELEAALSNIEAVTCDPEGNVCIRGSDGDRAVIQRALAARKGEQ